MARECPQFVSSTTTRVEIHDADYSYTQLQAWESNARALLSRPDVTLTGVNQLTNRVTVGVSQLDSGRAEILAELRRDGVPEAAVEIVQASAITPTPAPAHTKWMWLGVFVALAGLAVAVTTVAFRRAAKPKP